MDPRRLLDVVTTGLDPVVHVERRRGERRVSARYSPKDAPACPRYGLPDQARQWRRRGLSRFHRLVTGGLPQKPVPDVVTTGLDPVVHA